MFYSESKPWSVILFKPAAVQPFPSAVKLAVLLAVWTSAVMHMCFVLIG